MSEESKQSPPRRQPLGRRRQRLSDQETAERMLRAAYEMINEDGLAVLPANVPLEDVIRRSGVSRTAVYRRWPYKDLFYSDLLLHVARAAGPLSLAESTRRRLISGLPESVELGTPRHRHDFAVDLVRRGAQLDFATLSDTPQWRTYIALQASAASLPDAGLRERVHNALTESEERANAGIAATYAAFGDILGYRPDPATGMGYAELAAQLSAGMRGFALAASTNPGLSTTIEASAFGAAEQSRWSAPALAIAAIVFGCLRPDPDVEWDAARIDSVLPRLREALT